MAENPPEVSTEKQAAASTNNAPEELPPEADTNTPSTAQSTETMEVHHHAHHAHGKKKWKSYFWEFFMLFLAVFCGFLAELQLEHYIEGQREKKYIYRIYNDLKKDTAFYKQHARYQKDVYYLLDSSVAFLDTDSYNNNPDLFYKMLLRARSTRYLEYHNTAFDQMRSSGNLRLIKNESIAVFNS